LIQCFGISKQAFYKRLKSQKHKERQHRVLLEMVRGCRLRIGSQLGGLKLYHELKPEMESAGIKMGRDRFYRFLRTHNLLVRKTKRYHITTDSRHHYRKFKNLVKDKIPTAPEQLWVSDITYIKTEKGHNYLALVTDAYSKKIMGYKLAGHMRTELCLDALKMALGNRKYKKRKLIHHSDRGFQYCNPTYVKFATDNQMHISMTEQYDPYQNAIAERINRTLKYEYGLKQTIKNTTLAKKMTKEAVYIYNNLRPHLSLDMGKPNEVHRNPTVNCKSYRKNTVNLVPLTN